MATESTSCLAGVSTSMSRQEALEASELAAEDADKCTHAHIPLWHSVARGI